MSGPRRVFDPTLGGAAEPADHPYEHDPDTNGTDGERYCWCGWTREAHR